MVTCSAPRRKLRKRVLNFSVSVRKINSLMSNGYTLPKHALAEEKMSDGYSGRNSRAVTTAHGIVRLTKPVFPLPSLIQRRWKTDQKERKPTKQPDHKANTPLPHAERRIRQLAQPR